MKIYIIICESVSDWIVISCHKSKEAAEAKVLELDKKESLLAQRKNNLNLSRTYSVEEYELLC